jgi:serine/threonine protein kinase
VDTATGRLLDSRYRLGQVLGRGGMATVYAATDIKLRRQVAVKLFHPGADERADARLRTEAQLLGALVHPGLLRVFDLCVGEAESYLVMQLIEGRTLRNLIDEGPLRPVVVARLGARLAETLRYVHSQRIVHRDIKPSNVLLDSSGTGYLADFGIATLIGSARLTATGHCVGTAAYLAPEQVAGAGARPPADIYSLGLVLLECLTGRPEYPGSDVEAAIARLTRAPRVSDRLPPALRSILIAMLAREPAARPDAARCVELFEDYLARPNRAADPPTLAQMTVVQPGPPVRRWRPMHFAAAGVLLAGVVTGALLTTTAGGGQPGGQSPAPVQTPVPVVNVVPETAVGQVSGSPQATHQQPQPQQQPKPKKGKEKGGHAGGGGDR